MLELLSPAGSFEGFLAAIRAGADAIYLGGRAFGARAYAKNFSDEEVIKAIEIAHIYGKKVYLTLNTLCKEREFDAAIDFIEPFYLAGLDGVIVQDIGLIRELLSVYPDIEIHASTQMTLTGPAGAAYLKALGVSRIVPARELSLNEIRSIHEETGIEIEAFIHGAMCYSYSGQCLMSSFLGGRSGNRGRCAQPCRLPVKLLKNETPVNKSGEEYILSMKDLCTLKNLPDMIESGVSSFKIEGRMKSSDYTGFVTSMYRKYLDLYIEKGRDGYKVSDSDYNELVNRYKRSEPYNGYLYCHNSKKLITLVQPSYDGENSTSLDIPDVLKSPEVELEGWFYKNSASSLSVSMGDIKVTVTGDVCQVAEKTPTDEAAIKKQLSKLGQSEFSMKKITISMDNDIFLPLKSINELRRNAVALLREKLLEKSRRLASDINKRNSDSEELISNDYRKKQDDIQNDNVAGITSDFTLLVEKYEQLLAIDKCNVAFSRVYIEAKLAIDDYDRLISFIIAHKDSTSFILALPYIFRNDVADTISALLSKDEFVDCFDGFLLRNYEELYFINKTYKDKILISDFNMYSFNRSSVKALLSSKIAYTTLPLELSIHEIRERNYLSVSELLVYGRIPLMISAGCVLNTTLGCKKGNKSDLKLVDRYKKAFPVKTDCSFCYNRILNSVPISLLNEMESINKLGVNSLRIQLSTETLEEAINIIDALTGNAENFAGNFTKGHFRKSVE